VAIPGIFAETGFCETSAVSERPPSAAVVGHVEWVLFGRVRRLPSAGEVAHATGAFEEPAGGGAVAAVQLARLAGGCRLFTVLGEDEPGRASRARLRDLGVEVLDEPAAKRTLEPALERTGGEPEAPGAAQDWQGAVPTGGVSTRRAVTVVDDASERTITTFGERLDPAGDSGSAHWTELRGLDCVYFTAGDVPALKRAREAATVLVASPRARHALGHGVALDALVLSANDEIELAAAEPVQAEAEVVVYTEGGRGGRWRRRSGEEGRWPASPVPGPIVDSYGCGDSFAAGLTFGLGAGLALADALALAARCGAVCLTGAGPYQHQLTARELREQPPK
jgi:ribokinase